MTDLYQCRKCVVALAMSDFEVEPDRFRRARKLAEGEENLRSIRDKESVGLFVRRAFVRAACKIRNAEVAPRSITASEKRRFEREKAEVQRVLGKYASSTDRGIGWDPARWQVDVENVLPQTRQYVLTLADIFVRAQDEVITEAFSPAPQKGKPEKKPRIARVPANGMAAGEN